MKKIFLILNLVIGILLTSLGFLWLLQGLGIVYIEPVYCVTECEPVSGQSLQWQIMGVILAVFGVLLAFFAIKRLRKKHKETSP